MKFCPNCKHKLYEIEGGGFYCKNCEFVNDPNYKPGGKDGKPSNE